MRRPVRTGSCLLAWIAVAAAGAAAGPGPASAQGFDVPALLRRAEMRVFELKVTRNGGVLQSAGSAVALSKSPTAADGTVVAIFATAYHVMESAESFEIANHAGKPVARSGPGTRCFAFRTKDVAFIRVALEPNAAGLVEEMPTKASLPSPVQSGPSAEHVGGLAFGFSRERTLPIDYSQIELLGPAGADRLELIRSAAGFRPGQNEEAPSNMTFRLASRDPTWSGMSGGLVVDREFHFAGLVFGRQLDRYNIIIPADVVAAALGAAGDPARWAEFGTDSFRGMSPFRGTGDARDDEPIVDRREWGTIDGLIELIGEDPTLAIAQFQEITVNPPDTGKNSEVAVVVRDDCFKGGRKQSIEMSLDGGPPVALRLNASFRIPLDRDGEALLLVKKTSGDINDFEIGRFLAPSIVNLSFQQNNHEFLRVIRSLPQAVQAYPLFVAVRRSPPREPKPVADRPANARVAIRIDYAQGLLNQAPFRLGLKEGAGKSHFEGTYRLDPANGWELEYGSGQQLRIRAAGSVCVADARHEEVGLVLNPDQLNKRYPIAVRGRVQFPSEFGNFFISARATGTSGTFPLRVKLSNALEADLGGVLRYLFTTYLNNRLLFQGAPRMTEKGTVGRFLGELGLAAPQGWKPLDPRQVVLVRTAGGHTWLIATVRIDRPREGDRADDGAALPELLIPPVNGEGAVFDITAFGIPGETVARFPGLKLENPLALQGLTSARVDRLRLWFTPPDPADANGWLEPLAEPIPIRLDDTEKLSRRIREAFARSALRGRSTLSVALVPESAPAALARAVGHGALPLEAAGRGAIDLVATNGPENYRATAGLRGGPCAFRTPAGQAVDLGNGASLLGATLRADKLDLNGRGDRNELIGACAAELHAAKLVVGEITMDDITARVNVSVDTRRGGEIISGKIRLLRGWLSSPLGKIEVKESRDLRFGFDRRLTLVYDKAEFTRFAVEVLTGVPSGGNR